MNIFGWLLLILAVLLLAGLCFLVAVIAIEIRRKLHAARGSLKPVPYPNIPRAIWTGLLGAAIFILFVSKLSPRLGLGEVDYPYLVGSALPTGFGLAESARWLAGWLVCLFAGLGWALIYAFYVHERLPGPGWFQGLLYAGVGGSLISSLVFFPILGWMHPSVRTVLGNFLGHCLYGLTLGILYRRQLIF